MIVPTRRFFFWLAAGVPVAMVASVLGSPGVAIVYNAALIAAGLITSRLAPSTSHFKIRRGHDRVLSVRVANRIVLELENDGTERMRGQLRDEPPGDFAAEGQDFSFDLLPGQVRQVTYHVTPPERGTRHFRGTYLRLDCPFGLVQRQVKLDTEEEVRVYPNLLALREFDLLKQQGRLREIGIRRSRSRGLGTEFESLRQYAEGDDYRKIDWKASARRGDVMVRNYEQERNQSVLLCIDIGRHMLAEVHGVRKLDHVLDALLMLTNAAAVAGDQVGALVFAEGVRRYIPPQKGRAHLGLILDACHDLVAEPMESDPLGAMAYLGQRYKRRSLLIAFTDYEDPDRARALSVALSPMVHRHLTLLCRVLDPRFKEVLHHSPATVPDMYRRTAATLLMEDRRLAKSIVEAAGIRTLDSEPQELAANLVSYYFRVKEKNLL